MILFKKAKTIELCNKNEKLDLTLPIPLVLYLSFSEAKIIVSSHTAS